MIMGNLIKTSKYRYFNRSLRFAGMYREGLVNKRFGLIRNTEVIVQSPLDQLEISQEWKSIYRYFISFP